MPALAGVHHLKLPVTDLARSREWYRSRLGYQVQVEFVEQGRLMGYALAHPNGGPPLGLRLDPGRARAAAGFDYFAIGVPDKEAIDQLAARLDALGEEHAGVHWASIGCILPHLHDPDGHEIRFYTVQHHTEPAPGQVTTIYDPRETAGLPRAGRRPAARRPPAGGLEEKRCLRPGSGNCRKLAIAGPRRQAGRTRPPSRRASRAGQPPAHARPVPRSRVSPAACAALGVGEVPQPVLPTDLLTSAWEASLGTAGRLPVRLR